MAASPSTKVTVAVCGGVAAYKAVELVRLLQDAGLDPHVVMTRAAQEFVRPLTFAAISGHNVITDLWSEEAQALQGPAAVSSIQHIEEAQTTRALIVAPATAHVLAKLALGLADDFLTTMALASSAPLVLAPAMNVNMWQHPAVQANLALLRQRGAIIIEPGSGYLACGMVGGGRLADPSEIARAVLDLLDAHPGGAAPATLQAVSPSGPTILDLHPPPRPDHATADATDLHLVAPPGDLAGETVLVTAGGTREAIDPVRFLGNRSSGRMGYALAEAARRRGANVLLVSAPTALAPPPGCELLPVTSSAEMRDAVLARLAEASLVIMAAAVSDYTLREPAPTKLKRTGPRTLHLDPTPDILRELSSLRHPGTLVIGFAAETEATFDASLANARAKLDRKAIDAIVLNQVSLPGLGFDSPHNAGAFLTSSSILELPAMTKHDMAERILDQVHTLRQNSPLEAPAPVAE